LPRRVDVNDRGCSTEVRDFAKHDTLSTLVGPILQRFFLNLVAIGIALGLCQTAVGQPISGRRVLQLLEGRWSYGDCTKLFTEYTFSRSNGELTMQWGPDYGNRKLKVVVEYDSKGDLVLFFPSLNHRTLVVFIHADLRETIDTDADGRTTKAVWRRCFSQVG
jgi:hypothetical protein